MMPASGMEAKIPLDRQVTTDDDFAWAPDAVGRESREANAAVMAAALQSGGTLGKQRAEDAEEMALWVSVTGHDIASLNERLSFADRAQGAVAEAVTEKVLEALSLSGPWSILGVLRWSSQCWGVAAGVLTRVSR